MGTTWVSKIMTAQELDEGVTITVDLANGQYQVMHLILFWETSNLNIVIYL